MFKTKIFLLFPIVLLFILFFNIASVLASDCSCESSNVVWSIGLEDTCRKECKDRGYKTYNYGTSKNNSVDTQIQESNPSNLGGGCYCDGTYFANLGNEADCKSYCSDKKKQNYNYEKTGNKATGYTAPQSNTPGSSSSSFDYKVMEGIPGVITKSTTYTFNQYVSAVYNFAIWAVGICALLMLSVGAFMYLTSAGNNAAMSSAKGVITDALVGLILALTAWLLLYIINPDLVSPKGITGGTGGTGATSGGGSSGGTGTGTAPKPGGNTASPSAAYKKMCPNPSATTPIDYSKAASDPSIKTSTLCKNTSFANTSNVDQNKLRAISQVESGCGSSTKIGANGECGMMQMMPKTAKNLDSSLAGQSDSQVCTALQNDKNLSTNLAAKYVKQNESGLSTSDTFAGYNGGYGTTPGSSPTGKDPAMMQSNDCPTPGVKAYQCCKNPGGLTGNMNYTYNTTGLYSKYSAGQ